MNRRTLLAGVSVGLLSGCSGFRSGRDVPSGASQRSGQTSCDSRTTTRETEPTGRILRELNVESVQSVPVDGVDISVHLEPETITTDRTARLHVTFTNTSERERTFGFHGKRLPFSKRTSSPKYSWVLLTEADDPSRTRDDCWRPAGGREFYYQLDSIERKSLSSCESLSETLQLWTHPKSETCMPTGEYTFHENTFILFDAENGTETKEAEFSWGFQLNVQSP